MANLEEIVDNTRKIVLNSKEMDRALTRMAHEILEQNKGIENLALIGIRTGGVPLSERLQQRIAAIEGTMVSIGILDITLYRDDWSTLSQHPIVRKTDISFSVDNKNIILVDDVLYTGRTIRAAMDALTDLGRPKKIQLAVLVDRGRRELPIKPDFVGLSLQTSANEHINVFLNETAGRDDVVLEEEGPKSA
ncbi:MAG: bifunctional pyr operon transcriptional regulator/uracil phosphoribosyltransferase PyrR [Thermodesulfobacteriota bacterium]|nr:bifunctional pyr operon transcriptional regulator/uracil phosphoribosyltransferase PyrR [Thermodesulfobacteriota bacterium]